jgi:hypothetical protein
MILKNNSNTIIQAGVLTSSETRTSLRYGLVDAYSFDSGAQTSTSSGNNGTVSGAAPVSGKIGNAYTFTGSNHIALGDVSSYSFFHQTAQYAVSFWLRLDDYSERYSGVIFDNNQTTSAQIGISLNYENRISQPGVPSSVFQTFRVHLTRGIGGQPVYIAALPSYIVTDNNWHHLVLSGHGEDLLYGYFDGVKYELLLQGKHGTVGGNASSVFVVGNMANLYTTPIKGSIDNLLIYNRPLSQSEVSALYNVGAGIQYPFV